MTQFDDKNREDKVKLFREKEGEDLANILSKKYGLKYVDLTQISIDTDKLKLVPEIIAKENKLIVFGGVHKTIKVGVLSPNDSGTKSILKELEERGYILDIYMVSQKSLETVWKRYKDISFSTETKSGVLDISTEDIERALSETKSLNDVITSIKQTLALKKSYRVSKIMETILAGAISLNASDVHIEPEESSVRLRFRLNGILTNILDFDPETYHLLLSRLKLLSGLKLNVKDQAQDGRFSIKLSQTDIEIRASSIPDSYGEAIVLRILNPETIKVSMEGLGMDKDLYQTVLAEIEKPNGMVLNTGPTGSGKTTALYSFLQKIHRPEIKIITIEDPVEYHLPGIVQTQVDSKRNYNFSSGLKASLRQDPDIIMVGEIRDEETAKTAIHAALTGHLVLSTLHTNSAAGTFPRLIDLGVDPKTIGPAMNIAMAQRLVRVLDEKKKKKIPIPDVDKKLIEEILSGVKDKNKIPQTNYVWIPDTEEGDISGYSGRVGIFEAIVVDNKMEELIAREPRETEITELAEERGLLNIKQDGVIKVLNGITTIEELRRVVDL